MGDLDLTAAYDSVPREPLIQRMRKLLPKNLCDMIEVFLTPSWINTAGDTTKNWFFVDRGVLQGSNLSPSLYNLFMDEFADRITQVPRETADLAAVLFADDVLLSAKSPERLQSLLDIASAWAQDYQMAWNTKPGKHEVVLSTDTRSQTFYSRRQASHKSQRYDLPRGVPELFRSYVLHDD